MSIVLHDDRRPWVVLLLRLLPSPVAFESKDDDDDDFDDADGDASSTDEMFT